MADELFQFDRRTVQRINDAVRQVEGQDPGKQPPKPTKNEQRPKQVSESPGFWIQLTGEGTGADVGLYSWKMIYPSPATAGGWADASPAVTGTTNARESSGITGLYSATKARRFYVDFTGYDGSGNPFYAFSAGSESKAIYRMKVTTVSPGGNTALVLAKLFDGTTMTGSDLAVKKVATHAVNDQIYATEPVGGTDQTYSSAPVTWIEIAPLSITLSGNLADVFQILSTGPVTAGFGPLRVQ